MYSAAARTLLTCRRVRAKWRPSALRISAGIFPVLAEEAAAQWTGKFNPRPVDEADLRALYEAAL